MNDSLLLKGLIELLELPPVDHAAQVDLPVAPLLVIHSAKTKSKFKYSGQNRDSYASKLP